jgi:hypothetical protein
MQYDRLYSYKFWMSFTHLTRHSQAFYHYHRKGGKTKGKQYMEDQIQCAIFVLMSVCQAK